MATGDNCKKVGKYCMVAGGVTFFIMALSSTFILDLVFIAALHKQVNDASKTGNDKKIGELGKFAATYWLWNVISKSSDPLILFLFSPFVSMAAAALAVYLDVAFIAWGIAAGWGLGLALVLVGYGLYKLGQHLSNEKPPAPPEGATAYNSGIVGRTMERFGLFEVLPVAVASAINPQEHNIETPLYGIDGGQIGLPEATATYSY